MKKRMIVGLMIGLTGLSLQAAAQEAETEHAADHEALRELRSAVVAALNTQDAAALAPHLADEFVYSGIDQTVITDLDRLEAYFNRVFKSPDSRVQGMTIEVTPETLTKFIAEDVGICYGTAKENYTFTNGKEGVLNSRWTVTCVKQDGAWKVCAVQSGANVLDNSVLRYTIGFWRNCTVAGTIVGLVVGLAVSSLLRKRKSA